MNPRRPKDGPGEEAMRSWIEEHLPYEHQMMEQALWQLKAIQRKTALDQLNWNAFYVAFVVHARNICYFLENDHNAAVRACDFNKNFRSKKPNGIAPAFNKLNEQVLHPSHRRFISPDEKLGPDICEKIAAWLTTEVETFIKKLRPPFDTLWDWRKAHRPEAPETVMVPPRDPSATGAIFNTSSTQTYSTVLIPSGKGATLKIGTSEPKDVKPASGYKPNES